MTGLRGSVRSLIVGRLLVVSSLLVAAVVIQLSTASFLPLGPFYSLVGGTYVLSLVYLVLYRLDRHYRVQGYLQVLFDLLFVTALVYISGGIDGQLHFLYVFVIIAAGLVLGGREAYLTAALSAILFGALADGLAFGLIPYFREVPGGAPALGFSLYTIFTAWGLDAVIALLVARLSSSLRRTRSALDQAQREIEARERLAAAGRASALVAHEIRNPLAAISGSVQVLRKELALSPDQDRLMGIVVRESQRVSQTIEQFLSLSAPGRETFSVFSLEEVMAETLTMIRMSGELDDRIEVRGNYTQTAFEFFGNPGQFKQVFWNLFRNALRAMPEGGVLTLDLAQRKRGELAIRVADTGLGMTAEESSHMFEPFYTRFEGGRGLGLAVVRQIIDGYGGRIEVRSEPGVGTEILFTLPCRSPRRAEAEGARAGA